MPATIHYLALNLAYIPISALILLIMLCVLGAIVLTTVFWIWMLIDCATNKRLSDNQKVAWVLIIFFTHLVGALVYFFAGRSMPQQQTTYQPYMPPQAQAPQQQYQQYTSYRPYQEGYPVGQPMPPAYTSNMAPPPPPPPAEAHFPQDYEQPQAMYPQEQGEDPSRS